MPDSPSVGLEGALRRHLQRADAHLQVLFDLFFLYFFINFRDRPIRIFGWLALVFWMLGGLIGTILLGLNLIYGIPVVRAHSGWFMLSMMLILFGLLFILSGLTLEMIVRIYFLDASRTPYRLRKIWTAETDKFEARARSCAE